MFPTNPVGPREPVGPTDPVGPVGPAAPFTHSTQLRFVIPPINRYTFPSDNTETAIPSDLRKVVIASLAVRSATSFQPPLPYRLVCVAYKSDVSVGDIKLVIGIPPVIPDICCYCIF